MGKGCDEPVEEDRVPQQPRKKLQGDGSARCASCFSHRCDSSPEQLKEGLVFWLTVRGYNPSWPPSARQRRHQEAEGDKLCLAAFLLSMLPASSARGMVLPTVKMGPLPLAQSNPPSQTCSEACLLGNSASCPGDDINRSSCFG